MSANIETMFYYGEKPWHGLGKSVEKALTSAEAIEAAGLNWQVEKKPLFVQSQDESSFLQVPGSFATVRKDNGVVLGNVGSIYTVLQNKDAFSLADAIVGVKEAHYHTAGALGKGQRVWLLLKANGIIRTTKEDSTEKYLLLSNSHDGSSAVEIMFTPIRVVCQNTLNQAIGGTINKAKVRHTVNMGARVEEVRRTLSIANSYFGAFEAASQALVKIKFREKQIKKLIEESGAIPIETEEKQMTTRAKNIFEEISALFESGKGTALPGVKGTAWAAYNAVVEYVDHKRGKDELQRADSLLYGSGRRIKQKAWESVLTLAK